MKSLTYGHLKAGIDSVRGAKMRSFWTMLGVIIGVTSVITIVAIGEGVKQQVAGQIHQAGQNLITVRPAPLGGDSVTVNQGLSLVTGLSTNGPLSNKDIATVATQPGIGASAPLTLSPGSVKSDLGPYRDGYVLGTGSALPTLLNQSLTYGTFWTDDDAEANVAVLGQHAVDEMFDVNVPLGRSFTYKGEQFIVRGIFNQFAPMPLSQQLDFNNVIFIPHAVAQRLSNDTAPTYQMLARATDPAQTEALAATIDRALDKTHGGQSSFDVITGNQNLSGADHGILDLLTRLVAGVAAISLLVSGIGIMNVMLVSVAERMHEIGIRKAVGATNRQIWSQFMLESSVLTLTGGLIGISLAFLLNLLLRILTDLKPVISWEAVVLATGVSLLTGIIFGTVPAFQAARKDPIDALRSE